MTDINEQIRDRDADAASAMAVSFENGNPVAGADPALLDLAELLFFAYRDFIREPDKILDEYGFGRAHHRVLHFVNRHPGMRVADLLDILRITKQSLGRVLKQLIDDGFVVQKAGEADRRERHLFATPRGRELAGRLAAPQLERISRALAETGGDTHTSVASFLQQMISDEDRSRTAELIGGELRQRTSDRSPK